MTVGLLNELRVAIDLLSKGYEVFRAMSQQSSCDLAVLKNGSLLRIEVTTTVRQAGGGVAYPKKDNNRFDLLALVSREGDILYRPPLRA